MSATVYTSRDPEYDYEEYDDDGMVDPLGGTRPADIDNIDSRSAEPEPKRRMPVPSPRKPPRPASMASAVSIPRDSNGENNRNTSIQMENIHIAEPPYEEIRPAKTSSTWSEPPQTSSEPTTASSTPRSEPVITSSTPRSEPVITSSTPRSQPAAARSARSQPAKTSSSRYEPPKTSSTQSELARTSPTQAEPLGKEERRKKEFENKTKAAAEPDGDDYENSFMQRHKRPIMLVIFLLLVALAIALGIGARNASMVRSAGAFSSNKGEQCEHLCTNTDKYPNLPLVVIALNGFQSGFLQHQSLVRNIARLAECGMQGDTIPSYPSTAIPNLYSIVTGIYPAFHGMAADWLRAYGMNETVFGPAEYPNTYSRMDPKWFQLNGLWGIAADQGILTASHSWIGREGDIDEERPPSPSYYQTYDSGVDYRARIQTVLNWLHLDPSERPKFITVYFEDPGITARQYGFDSKKTMDSLARVDSAIGLLLDTLYEELDLGCVNVMVVSTGGMAERSCDKVYYLIDDLQNVDQFTLLPESVTSVGRITATDRSPLEMDTSEEILEHLQCKVDHGQVFTKRLLPVQLHSSYGLQQEDAVVLMDEGWTFTKQQEGYDRTNCQGASDGFNPYRRSMQGMFVGLGKSFKMGKTMPAVRNVDLFNLMAELINVTQSQNNGTLGIFANALTSPKTQEMVAVEFSTPRNAECSYPADDDEYDQRQRDSETGCACNRATLDLYPETSEVVLKDKDNNLRRTNVPNSIQLNAPFGFPQILRDVGPSGQDYCELYQTNFITAYENKLKIPLFATFSTRRNSVSVMQIDNCLRYDVRLQPERTPKCSSYNANMNPRLPLNIVQGFLYDPTLADSIDNELNVLTSANIVPQFSSFRQDVWLPLAGRIRQWANQGNRSAEMNVVIGAVYDWDSDTRRDTYHDVAASAAWVVDTPVPSHYFITATRCLEDTSLSMCSLPSLEVVSFVLPHTNSVKICQTFDDYLSMHLASLQDVELITGLHLFPDLSADEESRDELLQFKTRMPTMSPWMV